MPWPFRLLGVTCAIMVLAGPAARAAGPVDVLYAGSLVTLMEQSVGPAFDRTSGDRFRGFAGGSKGLANQISGKLRRGDVFISANPRVNDALMGPAHGDWISWYVSFAQSPLLIGYDPHSRFAGDFRNRPWYVAVAEPGVRIGRTDPRLDPKGALTVALLARAEAAYHQPGLSQRVLGAPDNPAQVLPEETLLGRLQSGQLDAGFFYSTETSDAHIPVVQLPADIRPEARYTVTVLHGAANPEGAARFAAFLLSDQGRALLQAHGLEVIAPTIGGDAAAAPAAIRAEAAAAAK